MPRKRNIVEGVAHMGIFVDVMPKIAGFLDARFDPEQLLKSYDDFINTPTPDINPENEDEGKGVLWDHWILQGKHLRFTIQFEKGEMLYFWYIRCPDEETYLTVKEFMNITFKPGPS